MNPSGGLFERLIDPDHLERAAIATVQGKLRRADVAWLWFRRESVLRRLGGQLQSGIWRPGGFDLLTIRDPKPRVIARAPIEDRVTHTALVTLMEPVFLPSLRDETYACRKGLGTHRARIALLGLMRRHRMSLHLDVRSYFPSIDLDILRRLIASRVRDRRFLEVVDRVIESGRGLYEAPEMRRHARLDADWPPPGRGLPIGALTSQLFAAHVYLGALDHFVKRVLKVPGYVRYVDDLYLFGDRRAQLRSWRAAIGEWLWTERSLRLKSPHARVLSCTGSLDGLGAVIRRNGIEPRRRSYRRLGASVARHIWWERGERRVDLERSVASRVGNLLYG